MKLIIKIFAFVIGISFGWQSLGASSEDDDALLKIQKEQKDLAARSRELAAQAKVLEEKKSLSFSVEEKREILAAFKEYVLEEDYRSQAWERKEFELLNSSVLMIRDLRHEYVSLYFAISGDKSSWQEGYGLSKHKGKWYVYVDYDTVQIGPEYVPSDIFLWLSEARSARSVASAQKERSFKEIIRRGVRYPWLLNEIARSEESRMCRKLHQKAGTQPR